MNKKRITIIAIIIIIGICIFLFLYNKSKGNNQIQNDSTYLELEIDQNQISYNDNATIEELKTDTGISGNDDLYEIQTEFDGRKVLVVKANIKYKVAFAGIIKKAEPKMDELDNILEKYFPQKDGIWVESSSRDKFLKLVNNSTNLNSKYSINEEGYLTVTEKNNQTELDKKLESIINSNKSNIISVSSVCYIIDDVTGKIIDYDFEFMDEYETYDYYEDDNKKIIFITENKENQLSNDEIIESVIKLL